MSKFDDTIKTKLKQLNEAGVGAPMAPISPTAVSPTNTAQPTDANAAQTETPPDQSQPTDPGSALAKVFQQIKFSDRSSTLQTLNNAMKTAGNMPGIKEFFTGVGFDPKTGQFMDVQGQQAQSPQNAPRG